MLHKLGYVHGDLKLQNVCFNRDMETYSIIDFALVQKIYHSNGTHKEQKTMRMF